MKRNSTSAAEGRRRGFAAGLILAALLTGLAVRATNYDESKVGVYTLPDPLVLKNGQPVRDADTWLRLRRPEILNFYLEDIHGHSPARPPGMTFTVFEEDRHALGGKAIRKQVTINFFGTADGPKADMLVYLPADAPQPVPVFLCLSFNAIDQIWPDPAIRLEKSWSRKTVSWQRDTDKDRGRAKGWPVDKILARGYGIAVINYCDIEPDLPDRGVTSQQKYGVRVHYLKPGQTGPAPDEWGAISAWAWGLSRGLDYLETDKDVDAKRIIALGQSRLGKTVLWASAQDTRFAMVVASCSGEMGAALSRRDYGETIDDMTRNYSYQFCANFKQYAHHWNDLPVDSHMLISLIAPRPLYLNTGSLDRWSDPHGEFLAAVAAAPVYRLFGEEGLGTDQMPPLDTPLLKGMIGFQCHTGKHEILISDWDRFLDFADLHLKPKS